MQHAQVTKILKTLETRRLIQQVKSVASKTKKVYMLVGLEPARELTGGSWYSGGEFDYELISILQRASVAYVSQREKATAAEVHRFICESGLIKGKQLRLADIEQVLHSLVYDAKIEVSARQPGQISDSDEPTYTLVQKLPRLEAMIGALTSIPPKYWGIQEMTGPSVEHAAAS